MLGTEKKRFNWRGGLLGLLATAALIAVGILINNQLNKRAPSPPPKILGRTEEPKETKPIIAKPEHVRGIYLTAWGAGSNRKLTKMLALLDRTELNSLVIDVRDDGEIYWKTGIALATESGATHVAVLKPQAVMERLRKHTVYPIARIACFRDAFVPRKHPELAVQNPKGGLWKDRSGHTWLDPYNKKNWQYLAQVVDFALDMGFPEIQLDYVRFPSEGTGMPQVFPAKKSFSTAKTKYTDVIAEFANFIRERVKAKGAILSADIFGIVSSSPSDQGIGQSLEEVAKPFDLISPMVYPSHFHKGEYGIANPDASPRAIILKSLRDFSKRLPNKAIRPWLQDFSLYAVYGKQQVQAQIRACKEMGYEEYLLWNPRNNYTEAAVTDNANLIPKKRAQ